MDFTEVISALHDSKPNSMNVSVTKYIHFQYFYIQDWLVFSYVQYLMKSLNIPKGNQNPYIEEGQTTQWPTEKRTKGQTTIYKTQHRKLKIW
jgi:hypothetical protein